MMEDTGEDVLRQKPSIVATFFKRVGQVRIERKQLILITIQLDFVEH